MAFLTKEKKAVHIMAKIAKNGGKPLALHKLVGDISISYCEQFANLLKMSGLIKSQKGPGGGYMLVRKPEDITLGEIADCVRSYATVAAENKIDRAFADSLDTALGHLDSVTLAEVISK